MQTYTVFDQYINYVAKWYRTDEKYYHTIDHVRNMFKLFLMYENQFDEEFKDDDIWYNAEDGKRNLFWSIAYHDAFYMPGFCMNEKFSAEIADEQLWKVCGIDRVAIKNIIISTVPGWKQIDNSLKKIIHDLDWSGFLDYNVMLSNEKKILTEAVEVGRYNKNVVVANQIKFYKEFANVDTYLTKTFAKFNDCVKINLNRRIGELEKEK